MRPRALLGAIALSAWWGCTDVVHLTLDTPTPPPAATPLPPVGLTGTAGVSSVSITWTANAASEGVDYYNLYGAQGTWSAWNISLPGATQDTRLACCGFLRAALEDEKSYRFAITAVNSNGESAFSSQIAARPPGWAGRRQFGTAGGERGMAAGIDSQLNLFVFGDTTGSMEGMNAGSRDAFVLRLDGAGKVSWIRQDGSAALEEIYGGAVDPAGFALEVGYTQGSLEGSNLGLNDAFVAKYAPDSTLIWLRQFGTAASDDARAVATQGTSRVIVVGRTGGSIDGTNAGSGDAFLRIYDAGGNVVLSRQVGSAQIDDVSAVAVDASGNVFMGGFTFGVLPGQTDNGPPSDAFIVKYSQAGNRDLIHQFAIGGVNGIAVCDDQSVVIVGNSNGAFIRRITNAGLELLMMPIASAVEQANAVAVEPASCTIYVAGTTAGAVEGANAGGEDAFVAKFTASGVLQWARQIGTTANDSGLAVAVDKNDSVYLVGMTQGTVATGGGGGSDVFVVKFDTSGLEQ